MNKQDKIFLLGFMGCGKSSLGKKLAIKLKYNFIDLDVFIAQQENSSIPTIFKIQGEDYFRNVEQKALKTIGNLSQKVVVALGGGTPCFFNNMEVIKDCGIAIYLKYNSGILAHRLLNAKIERPLIKGKNKVELIAFIDKSLRKREKNYIQSNFVLEHNNIKVNHLLALIKG